MPTVTPTQIAAQLKNLRFSTLGDTAATQLSGTIFDAGQSAMYAVVDYANWPDDTPVKVEVRRNGVKLPLSNQSWTDRIIGTGILTIPLITDSRQLIPQLYRTTIQAEEETLDGVFRISPVDGKPGTVLITETFEDNLHGLAQWQRLDSSGSIEGGRFQVTTLVTSNLTTVGLPISLEDFNITFETQIDPASIDSIVGLLFRSDERGAYAFEMAGDGSWSFGLSAPAVKAPIYSAKNSGAIQAGGMANRFRVIGQGNRIAFYANDIKLGEVTEDRFNLKSGTVALGARSPTGTPVTAWIDNVSITLPETLAVTTDEPALKAFATQMREAAQAALEIDALLGESQRELDAATCAEIMPRFYQAMNIALPDMTNQPSDVKRAVRSYGGIVQDLNRAVPLVQKICEAGGGLLESAEFEEFASTIRQAGETFWGAYIVTK